MFMTSTNGSPIENNFGPLLIKNRSSRLDQICSSQEAVLKQSIDQLLSLVKSPNEDASDLNEQSRQ